ncbi:E3 ubiquitin-protein ligase NRDP1-like isoform X2 [Adelges cooleyi]|uniref:E3 ubiquitin-protein ligase NRDP1-like isoform X2 n=1 Tax=Adelges cooleyi TaxID=133065 RepID=UPI00217F2963|nr:E3 ubiquitin-protein ligase NRDP1-like isoform X2 [Adelges cooleyi]
MCIKYISLLCLIYNMPTENCAGNGMKKYSRLGMNTDEPETSNSIEDMNNKTNKPEKYKTIEEWSHDFERATDIDWDKVLSKPSEYQKNEIKEALVKTNCPDHILEGLLVKSEHRNWPYEVEQSVLGRFTSHLDKYKCRRLPETPAVIVVPSENETLPKDYRLQPPGLLFIFEKVKTISDILATSDFD